MLPHEREVWKDTAARSLRRATLGCKSTTIRVPERYLLHLKAHNISITRFVTDALRQALESLSIDLTKPHPEEYWGKIEGRAVSVAEYEREAGISVVPPTE